jgi:hypothetical protein
LFVTHSSVSDIVHNYSLNNRLLVTLVVWRRNVYKWVHYSLFRSIQLFHYLISWYISLASFSQSWSLVISMRISTICYCLVLWSWFHCTHCRSKIDLVSTGLKPIVSSFWIKMGRTVAPSIRCYNYVFLARVDSNELFISKFYINDFLLINFWSS